MSSPILHVGAQVFCPHTAAVSAQTSNTRVKVSGQAVVTATDSFTVTGCPFQVPAPPGTKPQPCVTVRWSVPAQRVRVNGKPVLLQSSSGIGQSAEQIPQGPATVASTQVRVKGI